MFSPLSTSKSSLWISSVTQIKTLNQWKGNPRVELMSWLHEYSKGKWWGLLETALYEFIWRLGYYWAVQGPLTADEELGRPNRSYYTKAPVEILDWHDMRYNICCKIWLEFKKSYTAASFTFSNWVTCLYTHFTTQHKEEKERNECKSWWWLWG